jgi:hypothetical protein
MSTKQLLLPPESRGQYKVAALAPGSISAARSAGYLNGRKKKSEGLFASPRSQVFIKAEGSGHVGLDGEAELNRMSASGEGFTWSRFYLVRKEGRDLRPSKREPRPFVAPSGLSF